MKDKQDARFLPIPKDDPHPGPTAGRAKPSIAQLQLALKKMQDRNDILSAKLFMATIMLSNTREELDEALATLKSADRVCTLLGHEFGWQLQARAVISRVAGEQ